MNDVVPSSENLTDDDLLRFTQRTRKRLIDDMTKGDMPSDNKDRMVLLTALADMDRTALGNKKIGAAEQIAESDRIAAQAIARMNRMFGNNDNFAIAEEIPDYIEGVSRRIQGPELDLELVPDITVAPGEMDQGLSAMTYDEFMKHMDGE